MRAFPFGSLLVFALVACAAPQEETEAPAATAPDPTAVRAAIDAINAENTAAMSSGDSARAMGILAHYEDGAMVMMPGAPGMAGRAAIEQGIIGMLSTAKISDMNVTTADVIVTGDYAIESGTFSWTLTPKGGKPAPDKGKYLTVWHRQADGSWKILRDINNSDIAPPTS
ncbi:MAG: DUF4440 domain-containing protein [Gemmatimonadaceae bacterium]|nr:DUF4440 domain-containing protein [Gemmatimonadaceae bacterium]